MLKMQSLLFLEGVDPQILQQALNNLVEIADDDEPIETILRLPKAVMLMKKKTRLPSGAIKLAEEPINSRVTRRLNLLLLLLPQLLKWLLQFPTGQYLMKSISGTQILLHQPVR